MSLRDLAQNSLASQVDDVAASLTEIRDNQIPTIQNQTVSVFGSVNQLWLVWQIGVYKIIVILTVPQSGEVLICCFVAHFAPAF